jgi:hypothetical protein
MRPEILVRHRWIGGYNNDIKTMIGCLVTIVACIGQ